MLPVTRDMLQVSVAYVLIIAVLLFLMGQQERRALVRDVRSAPEWWWRWLRVRMRRYRAARINADAQRRRELGAIIAASERRRS